MSNEELISKYVRDAQQSRFWGMLQLDFQDGQLTLIRREETIKVKPNHTGSNPCPQQSNY